jgi:probable F420-dependent oxidoreductase
VDLGIVLPIWGPNASPEAIRHVGERAERIGLGAVWTSERLLRPAEPYMIGVGPMPLPESLATVYDPLEVLTYVAAATTRIRLGTSVLVGLFHNPIILARRLATLDRLSAGRLIFGVGQGWMAQEFAAAGVPRTRRGVGFEEHLAAMRAVWGPDPVRFDGRFYHIPESQIGPKPVRPDGPTVLIGAAAPAAVERAARLGLGLIQVMFAWDMLRSTLEQFSNAAAGAGHAVGSLPVVVQVNGAVSSQPVADRAPLTGSIEQVADDLRELNSLGVEHVFWAAMDSDPDDQLQALELVLARGWS